MKRLTSNVLSMLFKIAEIAIGAEPRRADLKVPGLRNFHKVTPWLYRGGQPTAQGIETLAQLGIKTVVSFRWGTKVNRAEEAAVVAKGMRYECIPLNYFNLPDQASVDRFLALVDNAENQPLYVHCFHGADRTGIMIAIFRITRQNWNLQQAYDEMKACGFHRFRLRHFKWVLFSYGRRATHPQRSYQA